MESQGNNHDSNAPSISDQTFDLNLLPSEQDQVGETEQGSSSSGTQLNKRKAPEEGTSGVNLEAHLGSHQDAESYDEIPLIDINDFIDYSGSTDRSTRQRTYREDENNLPENTSIPGSSARRRDFVTLPQQSPPPPSSSTISNGVTTPNLLGPPSVGVQLSNPSDTGIQMPSQTSFGLGFQHGVANPPPNFHIFPRLSDPQRLETSGYHPADQNVSFEATISRMASLAGYRPQSIQSLVERARIQYLLAPAWQPAAFSVAAAVRRALFATPEELAFEAELLQAAELFRQSQEEFLDEEEILDAGLSEETILANLQRRTYGATTPQADTESCSICLDEYKEGHQLGRLDCCHEFHFECIKLWLEEKNTCPLCKRTGLAQ